MSRKYLFTALIATTFAMTSLTAFGSSTITFTATLKDGSCAVNQTILTCQKQRNTKEQNKPIDIQNMIKNNKSEFENNGTLIKIDKINEKNYIVRTYEN